MGIQPSLICNSLLVLCGDSVDTNTVVQQLRRDAAEPIVDYHIILCLPHKVCFVILVAWNALNNQFPIHLVGQCLDSISVCWQYTTYAELLFYTIYSFDSLFLTDRSLAVWDQGRLCHPSYLHRVSGMLLCSLWASMCSVCCLLPDNVLRYVWLATHMLSLGEELSPKVLLCFFPNVVATFTRHTHGDDVLIFYFLFSHSHIPGSPLAVTPCRDAQQRWGPSGVLAGGTGRLAPGKSSVTAEGVCYSKLCTFLVACGPPPQRVNQKGIKVISDCCICMCPTIPDEFALPCVFMSSVFFLAISGTTSYTVRPGDLGHAQPQCQPYCTGTPPLQCRAPRAQQRWPPRLRSWGEGPYLEGRRLSVPAYAGVLHENLLKFQYLFINDYLIFVPQLTFHIFKLSILCIFKIFRCSILFSV